MNFSILIVDDEKNIREGLAASMEMDGYEVVLASNGVEALRVLEKEYADLVIADLKMPEMGGEELLKHISSAYPTVPVIILTGHGTIESAVNAMRNGAYDFLTKPVNLNRLSLLVKRALSNRELVLKHRELQEEVRRISSRRKYSDIIGKSAQMKRVLDVVEQVASTKASVLITGESGVGKELVANALVQLSDRAEKPFIKVHCAALSESLLESELFGHEKGSFTGAVARKRGRFELANTGTIFLDEIGEISSQVQVKILRVLQEKKFERVGGEETLEVDVRIISATNRDLKAEIQTGNFREDLFYRLNVVNIFVPPLRERKEDILLLATAFLKEFAEENGKSIQGIDSRARMLLSAYSWPGNVRELRNCMESAVVMCRSNSISVEDLPPSVVDEKDASDIRVPLGSTMEEAEKRILQHTLVFAGGNKTKAADMLGIGRKTLHRKIAEYGLEE
ncbi:MAG: sigma-54-dependent Fis family transcriptional regulator [Spirochaetales bacterium]|nr:sigma-54-dependent Fis family transcriptional regulator [Spirochaetales bacterium]